MQKILVKLDLTKIDKEKIETRTYTTKEGVEVTQKLYPIEIVESASTQTIKEGDTWNLKKTHMVFGGQTKEERQQQVKAPYLGDGLQFVDKQEAVDDEYENYLNNDNTNPEDLPF